MQDLQAEKIVSLLFETKQTLITSHQYNEGLAYKSEIKLILCKIAADVGDGVKNIQREGPSFIFTGRGTDNLQCLLGECTKFSRRLGVRCQFNDFKGEEIKSFSLSYRKKKENY